MSSVLAVGAHPDDIELGCAGLLQRYDEKYMVILSAGEKGCDVPLDDRRQEAKAAAKLLGAHLFLHDLPDTKIEVVDAVQIIESYVFPFHPDLVLTMSTADVHQDHQTVHSATKIAVRDAMCTVLAYMSPSSAQTFHPNWFVPLTEEQMQTKLQALVCHHSQRNRSYFAKEYVLGMARYWAMVTRSQSEYVEPYELIRRWEAV